MASINERNVAGLYRGHTRDSISCVLHSNSGYEVEFNIWEDLDGEYHVFATTDDNTEDFLRENYPETLREYLLMVEQIPTASSKWLSLINSFISSQTYNSIRPLIENEEDWLTLDEEELDRD